MSSSACCNGPPAMGWRVASRFQFSLSWEIPAREARVAETRAARVRAIIQRPLIWILIEEARSQAASNGARLQPMRESVTLVMLVLQSGRIRNVATPSAWRPKASSSSSEASDEFRHENASCDTLRCLLFESAAASLSREPRQPQPPKEPDSFVIKRRGMSRVRPVEPDFLPPLERVRVEYVEMPGMKLTARQVQRLCGIEQKPCKTALDTLVDAKFLCVTADGRYARLTHPKRKRRADYSRRQADADPRSATN
jgi:hypothetical protein